MDLTITEYQLMQESDVVGEILGMKLASQYINAVDLQGLTHRLFTRPTIAFKLECETSAGLKQRVVDLTSRTVEA